MTIVFYVGSRWKEREASDEPTPAREPARPNPASAARFGTAALAATALVAIGPGLALALQHSAAGKSDHVSLPVPAADGAWRPTEGQLTTWESPFQNHTAALRQSYRDGDARIELVMAFYRNQHTGAKLLSLASTALSDYDVRWIVVDRRRVQIENRGDTLQVIEKRLQLAQSTSQNLLVWEWYWVSGLETTSLWRAKLAGARARLTGAGDDAGAIVLLTPYRDDPSAARQALRAFVTQMHSAISKTLADAAAQ
jgi:EpsI family protein